MVAVGIDKTGTKVLEDVLSLVPPAAEHGRPALPEEASYRRAVRRALATEDVIFGMTTFAAVAEGDPGVIDAVAREGLGQAIPGSVFYRVFFLQEDLAAYRRAMHEMQQIAAKPYYEAGPDWQAHEQSWQRNRR